jgi:hypothetical protein
LALDTCSPFPTLKPNDLSLRALPMRWHVEGDIAINGALFITAPHRSPKPINGLLARIALQLIIGISFGPCKFVFGQIVIQILNFNLQHLAIDISPGNQAHKAKQLYKESVPHEDIKPKRKTDNLFLLANQKIYPDQNRPSGIEIRPDN